MPPRKAESVTRIGYSGGIGQSRITSDALRAGILRCVRCEALVQCRSRVVPGAGPAPAAIAFVGLAPGRRGADRTGVPFSGDRSGELLRRMIRRTRLDPVFITNVVRCNPRDSSGRNRDPSAEEIANCRPHLEAELALARPRIIVCLGRVAWRVIAGPDIRFNPRALPAVERAGTILFAMYHPAYVNRGGYGLRAYTRDFIALRRLSEGARVPITPRAT